MKSAERVTEGQRPGFRPERLLAGVAASVLAVGLAAASSVVPAADAAVGKGEITRGITSSVKVWTLDAAMKVVGTCSGTVIDPSGYVLTNFHCVGEVPHAASGERPVGAMVHPQGIIAIGLTTSEKKAPQPTYLARVVVGRPDVDVAVAKIYRMVAEKQPLPRQLPLVVMPLGDSDGVQVRDAVHVVGYPGVGGDFINVASGIVSGYDDLNRDGELDSIKTDAEIAGGNSGGLVMDDEGFQVGIATWGRESGASKVDRMMAINVARPYVQEAIRLGGTQVGVAPERAQIYLPAAAQRPAPQPGQPAQPSQTGTLPGPQAPAQGQQAQRPADVASITGTLIDGDTKRPIPQAVMAILKPGVTTAQYDAAQGAAQEQLLLALVPTDASGTYVSSPVLHPLTTYTLIVGAQGYSRRTFDAGLEMDAGDVGLIQVQPIELRRK